MEFLGFGGHAILGGIGHNKLRTALPEATFLPVMLIPNDPALWELMRRETWYEYEKHLAGTTVLITDNRVGEPADVDDRLAVGLASIESAAHSDPTSGTLAEAVASLAPHSSGWLGMSVVRRRLPSQNSWGLHLPLRRRTLVWGRDNELAWQAKKAIQDSLRPEAQLARHESPGDDVLQRVVVALPLRQEELDDFKQNVIGQLQAEGFFQMYPSLAISFCSANFPERPDKPYRGKRVRRGLRWFLMTPLRFVGKIFRFFGKGIGVAWGKIISRCADDLYLNVARIYPLQGSIKSVEDIMGQGSPVSEERTWTGFGSRYYLNGAQQAVGASSEPSGVGGSGYY